MGARGKPPTPTNILKLRGSWRADQRAGEPQPERGRPEHPDGLSQELVELWQQVCNILDAMGVLTVADGLQLERYVRMFVLWRRTQEVIDRYSTADAMIAVWNDDEKRPAYDRALRQSRHLDGALKQVENNFGLSPAARARLGALLNEKPSAAVDKRESEFFGSA